MDEVMNERICTLTRECLERRFPLWEKEHSIRTSPVPSGQIWIGYQTKEDIREHFNSTHFDLNIIGDTCFLTSIGVSQENRKKGFGKDLYRTVEEIATLYGCKKVRMTPSGWTSTGKTRKDYMMGSLGYTPVGDIEVQKILNP